VKLSAFSVNTIFVVLMLLGISLIPVLSLQLLPSSRSNDLSVSFSWDNAGPELLEIESLIVPQPFPVSETISRNPLVRAKAPSNLVVTSISSNSWPALSQ